MTFVYKILSAWTSCSNLVLHEKCALQYKYETQFLPIQEEESGDLCEYCNFT